MSKPPKPSHHFNCHSNPQAVCTPHYSLRRSGRRHGDLSYIRNHLGRAQANLSSATLLMDDGLWNFYPISHRPKISRVTRNRPNNCQANNAQTPFRLFSHTLRHSRRITFIPGSHNEDYSCAELQVPYAKQGNLRFPYFFPTPSLPSFLP